VGRGHGRQGHFKRSRVIHDGMEAPDGILALS
jgi:hypothetical protein